MRGVRGCFGFIAGFQLLSMGVALSQVQPNYLAPLPQQFTPRPAVIPAAPVAVPSPAQATAPAQVFAPRLADPNPAQPALSEATPGGATGAAATPVKKPKPKVAAAPPKPGETALPTDPAPTFAPDTYSFTLVAADRYTNIVLAGGWPEVVNGLKPGSRGPDVATLRQRLSIEGDLDTGFSFGEAWDENLTTAVKRFQRRMGLRQTAIVTGATLKAMNVPADVRARQLGASAQRIESINFPFGERYVVVNIPSAVVEAVEGDRVVHRYVAVVGDVKHRSPEVVTRIQAVNLNPTWTLPTSIIKNEIIPKMRKDPGYLGRTKIRMLDSSGQEVNPASIDWSTNRAVNYTLRQDSGNANALGNIRINMPNSDSVYMHDTPSKRFFGSDYRFLSHGCVRVAGVFDFAQWLLEGTNGSWDKAAMLAKVATKERTDIRLARPVPVIWTYMTGWVSPDGIVHFRNDVYDYDTQSAMQARAERAIARR